MVSVSVVVITSNEEDNIVDCIRSAAQISKDIIVVDCGSSDNTRKLAAGTGARVFTVSWQGYGHARNFGAAQAANDWIFAMDADERISGTLAKAVGQLQPTNDTFIYRFSRRNHLAGKRIRFGTPGFETVTRIYNRRFARWDQSRVHEKLSAKAPVIKRVAGSIDHFSLRSVDDYAAKMERYARLSAEKYLDEGKEKFALKGIFSTVFNATKSYFFLLGFLDGRTGLVVAGMIGRYSWLKYFYLRRAMKLHSKTQTEIIGSPQVDH